MATIDGIFYNDDTDTYTVCACGRRVCAVETYDRAEEIYYYLCETE